MDLFYCKCQIHLMPFLRQLFNRQPAILNFGFQGSNIRPTHPRYPNSCMPTALVPTSFLDSSSILARCPAHRSRPALMVSVIKEHHQLNISPLPLGSRMIYMFFKTFAHVSSYIHGLVRNHSFGIVMRKKNTKSQ